MNFLSHYYLHNIPADNYYTVGLTTPDLLGFHSKRIRITKKFLSELTAREENLSVKSFISGMTMHILVDSWFHNSSFFKEKVAFLQEYYSGFNPKKEYFPGFFAHILLEILIDRYLLLIQPGIVDDFYESYKSFDFSKVSMLFKSIENFDEEKFLKLTKDVSYSSFLRDYTHDELIIKILDRVCKRLDLTLDLNYNENNFISFIGQSYKLLESSIKEFMENAKKEEIIVF